MTENEISIGIWGCGSPVEISAAGRSTDRGGSRDQRCLRYLRQCKKRLYLELYMSGKLNDYLAEINAQAEDMFFRVVKEVSVREDVTEALKASDQITWVQQSNSIRERAAEIVNKELIYI